MQMPHVIHDVFGGPMDAMGGQLNLDTAQIYHRSDTYKQMTPDFAVRPVPDRTDTDCILMIADTEPVFNLPAIDACFHDFPGTPVDVVCNDEDFWKAYDLTSGQDRVMLSVMVYLAARRGEVFK